MAEIVNLNRVRKARAKADDRALAAANRAAHGRTRAEKQAARREQEALDRTLDGARRDDD